MDYSEYNIPIKNGDSNAFKIVFDGLFYSLQHYAYHFIKNDTLAEELVQEAFLILWKKRLMLNGRFNIKAYLFKTVHNQALNFLRHQKVIEKHSLEFQIPKPKYEQEDPLLAEALATAINSLSPRVKLIFEMCKFQGLKNKEIAEKLSISSKTVEVQIRNAKLILKKSLKPFYEDL